MLLCSRVSSIVAMVTVLSAAACPGASSAPGGEEGAPPSVGKLPVVSGPYPRALFFRSAEGFAANPRVTYARWDASFRRLMGIIGKTLDEEVLGRQKRNIEFFTRFKRAHPNQLVLLHYNGNARDPRYQAKDFFAGHWLHYPCAGILRDVAAESGESEIRVADVRGFRVNMGRYRTSNDDVALVELDAAGRPDWNKVEQVQLVSVDAKHKTIRVRRGCYGTVPRALAARRAAAAVHVTEGPWGRNNHIMWYYNYSTRCPRDAQGRRCLDVHAADVARRFLPGGELAAFDGLEFDVLHHRVGGGKGWRQPDCDGDGRGDRGWFDGTNTYGAGVIEFCRRLRAKLPRTLILADGHSPRNQRAVGILNGIESEGWPALTDLELRDYWGGINRHAYWAAFGAKPVFHYINHKFIERGDGPGVIRRPKLPWRTHRSVFAAATFTDAAVCYSFPPPKPRGEVIGIWDELCMGRESKLGWLGMPKGPVMYLADAARDAGPGGDLKAMRRSFRGRDVTFTPDGDALRIEPKGRAKSKAKGDVKSLTFILSGAAAGSGPLHVTVTARGESEPGFGPDAPRLMHVGLLPPPGVLITPEVPETGMCLRGKQDQPLDFDATGASVRYQPGASIGGVRRDAYFVHPPYKDRQTGYAYWQREIALPAKPRLLLHTGMGPKSPQRSDGVTFRVLVAERDGGDEWGTWTKVFEHSQKAHKWIPHEVSLAKWVGRTVRLRFVSDAGPKDHSVTDHSFWGDVMIAGPAGPPKRRRAERFMTWLGPKAFESRFVFNGDVPAAPRIEFTVEGRGPVWLSRVSLRSAGGAAYREFDHGLVLANPDAKPVTFDLKELLPTGRWRRLQGTPLQDPATNNGKGVGEKVTLGAKDALFLVRVK